MVQDDNARRTAIHLHFSLRTAGMDDNATNSIFHLDYLHGGNGACQGQKLLGCHDGLGDLGVAQLVGEALLLCDKLA